MTSIAVVAEKFKVKDISLANWGKEEIISLIPGACN